MDNPACTQGVDAALMPNLVRIHSDAAHRPRMEFAVTNPIRIEALHPQFVGDDLVVHTSMNSVWGNYDVGEVSPYTPDVTSDYISVGITGPRSDFLATAGSLRAEALLRRRADVPFRGRLTRGLARVPDFALVHRLGVQGGEIGRLQAVGRTPVFALAACHVTPAGG